MANIEDYIQNRVDNQIQWYSKKAALNKFRYRIMEIIIIVAGALIPIINSSAIFYDSDSSTKPDYSSLVFISSILGFTVTIATGLSQLEKYFESWTIYRTNAEVLKKEKFLYQNNGGQYSKLPQEDRNKLFVENVEFILSSEVTKYFSMQERVRQTVIEERKTSKTDEPSSSTPSTTPTTTTPSTTPTTTTPSTTPTTTTPSTTPTTTTPSTTPTTKPSTTADKKEKNDIQN